MQRKIKRIKQEEKTPSTKRSFKLLRMSNGNNIFQQGEKRGNKKKEEKTQKNAKKAKKAKNI